MNNKTYTISELEELTDINRRTIHLYVQEGIISPPDGTGGGAKYYEDHVLRLMLIKHMQKSHLKLSGIREALDAMTTEEMKRLLKKVETGGPEWDAHSIDNWLLYSKDETHLLKNEADPTKAQSNKFHTYSFLKTEGMQHKPPKAKEGSKSYLRELKRSPSPESSWKRIEVADGIEISIRLDRYNRYRSIINKWIGQLNKYIQGR